MREELLMPVYEFKNKETGEITEVMVKMAELEQFKQENPHLERHFTTINFADSVSLGIKKPPKDFQEGVIDRIKKNNPGHNMQSRWD